MWKCRAMQCIAALLVLASAPVRAQPIIPAPPPAYSERPNGVKPPVENRFAGNISAGTTLNGGNTRSYGATVGGRFQLIRQPHQFMAEAMGNWAKSRNPVTNDLDETAKNVVGRVRYDIYLAENDALFAALAPRSDRFAGLDLRLQSQAGYLRNLYAPADNHRLWLEVGYDGTYDNFTPFVPPGAPPTVTDLPASDFIHSARAFAGYTNLLTPLATLNLGLEFLYDFEDSENMRVNALAELSSSLSQRFKLSILSRILYDQKPVPDKKPADYMTTAQLVYTFDSFVPPPPCPACDCSSEVAAAKASCRLNQTTSPADLPTATAPPNEPPAAALPPPARSSAPAEPARPAAQAP